MRTGGMRRGAEGAKGLCKPFVCVCPPSGGDTCSCATCNGAEKSAVKENACVGSDYTWRCAALRFAQEYSKGVDKVVDHALTLFGYMQGLSERSLSRNCSAPSNDFCKAVNF